MVATRVDVHTRSMLPGAEPVIWRSTGAGAFTVLPGRARDPGYRDRAPPEGGRARVRQGVAGQGNHPKYSDFVQFPIDVERRARQPLGRDLGAPEVAGHGRAARRVLPAHHRLRRRQTPLLRGALCRSTRRCSSTRFSTCPRRRRSICSARIARAAPLRQARAHRRGLRQAHAPRTCASCAAWSTRRTSRSTSRARCCRRTGACSRSSSSSPSSVLKGLKELAESEPEQYAQASGREFGEVLKEGVATRLEAQGRARRALPLRVDEDRGGQAHLARAVRGRDARGAEGDLLRHRAEPRARWSRARTSRPSRSGATTCCFLIDPIDEWVVQVAHRVRQAEAQERGPRRGRPRRGTSETPKASRRPRRRYAR